MGNEIVVGVDIGATTTRALAATLTGTPLGRGDSGGSNPNAHPPDVAAARVGESVAAALAGHNPAAVLRCVLGMAGVSKISDSAVEATFVATLRDIGLRCPVRITSDAEVAFASGTAEPDGSVLIAGTGSIALRIEGNRGVRVAGGWGWLLGDEGSAYWIGREAVRAALRALQAAQPLGSMGRAVLAAAALDFPSDVDTSEPAVAAPLFHRLITACNAAPPIQLARFAPLVSEHVSEPDAQRIVRDAVAALVDAVREIRKPGERTPVVLAGSVLREGSPFGAAVRTSLTQERGTPVHFATDGAAGAARLATLDLAEMP